MGLRRRNTNSSPFVSWLADEIAAQMQADPSLTSRQLCDRAGVARSSVGNWFAGHSPSVDALDAVLAVLGYRLEIVPVEEE